ncbi:MAG TPA: DUF1800 family protein [Rhizomicrobium sp.]|nr:DUF1800 family protein [Rhizomicrobium sp.]
MIASKTLDGAIAVTRFGLGATPGELADAADDPRGWLKAQITRDGAEQPQGSLPGSVARVSDLIAYQGEIAPLRRQRKMAMTVGMVGQDEAADEHAADELKQERRAALQPLLEGVRDEIFARTRLATATAQSFRERWTLFWANHFTVSTAKLQSAVLVGPFEREAIRPHVFGRFEDMLMASTTHPGMLMYLDQAKSAGPNSMAGLYRKMGLNENLAREIMELHTVGADAGYTQADVTEFARALTGYSIGAKNDGPDVQGHFLYRPLLHEPGARTVMGRRYGQDGEDQARAILSDLAASPKTAAHLAHKLAIHFVADEPPPGLVARLREAYLASNGDLAHVATTLVDAQECWTPDARKFKTPYEFVVSGYRAAGASPSDPAKEIVQPLTFLGQRPFAAPQPNGWSDMAADWAAPDALVKRLTWATKFSAYYAPKDGAPVDVAAATLGERLTAAARTAIARAETRFEAFSILLMSPEFQRR